jgi:hypothetical protein
MLWLVAVGVFAAAELTVVYAFRTIPSDHLFLGTKYWIVFMVALPMVSGVNGYYSARRRLSSAGDDVTSVLSAQFPITIVTAYAALIVCIQPLAEAVRQFLK